MYLFDANAIVNLVKHGVTRVFEKGLTIDLARYETLNAIWKEYKVLKRIDEEKALELIEIISLILDTIEIKSIEGNEEKVLELAVNENLTIYDASYLFTAINNNLVLVTDDNKLREKASKYVRTLNTKQLIEQKMTGKT